jgi:hypothetical protein
VIVSFTSSQASRSAPTEAPAVRVTREREAHAADVAQESVERDRTPARAGAARRSGGGGHAASAEALASGDGGRRLYQSARHARAGAPHSYETLGT